MRLEAEGKARLEAMKRALAAGVPLAGLLAGAAVGSSEAVAEERGFGGDIVVSMGDLTAGGTTSEPDDAAKPGQWPETEAGEKEAPMDVPSPEVPEELEELTIAEDCKTLGILLPSTALSQAERGGEAEHRAADDVVIRLLDSASREVWKGIAPANSSVWHEIPVKDRCRKGVNYVSARLGDFEKVVGIVFRP